MDGFLEWAEFTELSDCRGDSSLDLCLRSPFSADSSHSKTSLSEPGASVEERGYKLDRLVPNYTLLLPNKGAKSTLRGIKQKKIPIIPLNLDLDLLFRISEV